VCGLHTSLNATESARRGAGIHRQIFACCLQLASPTALVRDPRPDVGEGSYLSDTRTVIPLPWSSTTLVWMSVTVKP
jgi:hypothetical protein